MNHVHVHAAAAAAAAARHLDHTDPVRPPFVRDRARRRAARPGSFLVRLQRNRIRGLCRRVEEETGTVLYCIYRSIPLLSATPSSSHTDVKESLRAGTYIWECQFSVHFLCRILSKCLMVYASRILVHLPIHSAYSHLRASVTAEVTCSYVIARCSVVRYCTFWSRGMMIKHSTVCYSELHGVWNIVEKPDRRLFSPVVDFHV